MFYLSSRESFIFTNILVTLLAELLKNETILKTLIQRCVRPRMVIRKFRPEIHIWILYGTQCVDKSNKEKTLVVSDTHKD